MLTRTLCALLITLLLGCTENQPNPSSGLSAQAVERISENSSDIALQTHGLQALQRWAEEGDRKAQHFVAAAYLAGTSVPKNYDLAQQWARRAANQGSAASQFLMGLLRRDAALGGNLLALEPNSILAYMWFSLAAANGHKMAKLEREKMEVNMDAAWIARAQTLAASWRPCNELPCQDGEPKP